MRPQLVILASITMFALTGCQIDEVDFHDEEVGSQTQASLGGAAANLPHHNSVAAITILLPLLEGQDPEQIDRDKFRYCSGVLVEDKVVMTAARCFSRNLEAQLDDDVMGEYLDAASVKIQFISATGGTEYFLDSTFVTGPTTTLGLTLHRYYDDDFPGTNDVALLRLSASPVGVEAGVQPATVNLAALGTAEESLLLELVGFGKNDTSGDPRDDFTSRRVISPMIESISETRVTAGTDLVTTCYADSGGPGFLDLGGPVPVVATLNVLHGECAADVRRQRVDKFANDFVQPFIDYVSGACDASATCGDCDYNGTCAEDCPTRDWDCELGSFTGDGCAKNGDCEEGGNCIPATDDPTFTYCSKGCTLDDPTSCPSTMTCADDVCVYEGISPGSQGATCGSPADCRSGFCESLICANACDASDPNSCDTAGGFSCLPSEADSSATVCRVQSESGGGGFCAISGPGSSSNNGALAGFGLIFLMGLFLRRRRK